MILCVLVKIRIIQLQISEALVLQVAAVSFCSCGSESSDCDMTGCDMCSHVHSSQETASSRFLQMLVTSYMTMLFLPSDTLNVLQKIRF